MLHSFNCIEFPVVFVALNRLGAICSSSPPMLDADGLAYQIQASEVRASVADDPPVLTTVNGLTD